MTQQELYKEIARRLNITYKEASIIPKLLIEIIKDELLKEGGKAVISGFGTFMLIERKARLARHPRTGAKINVPTKRIPKFIPSDKWIEEIRIKTKRIKRKSKDQK